MIYIYPLSNEKLAKKSAQNQQPFEWVDLTEIFVAFFFQNKKEDPNIFNYLEKGNGTSGFL